MVTADVDVVHRRDPDNVQRFLQVLGELQAVYRHDDRRLRPTESHLMGPGHQLLSTSLGPLDALGAIGGETYAELVRHSSTVDIGEGLAMLVLELPKLIELKRKAGRPKDFNGHKNVIHSRPIQRSSLDPLGHAVGARL